MNLLSAKTVHEQKKREQPVKANSLKILWRPQGDSNPCRRRERPVSWTWLDDGDVICRITFFWSPSRYSPQRGSNIQCVGGPCANRTRDQRIKSPLLYRTELTAQTGIWLLSTFSPGCQKNFRHHAVKKRSGPLNCRNRLYCFTNSPFQANKNPGEGFIHADRTRLYSLQPNGLRNASRSQSMRKRFSRISANSSSLGR